MATKAPARAGLKKRIRKIFGDIHEVVQMPNLIEVQRDRTSSSSAPIRPPAMSRAWKRPCARCSRSRISPAPPADIKERDGYVLEAPKYDVNECRQRGITYAAPMKVTLKLATFEVDAETETKSLIDIKEQDVYMGDIPLMTDNGTFIINGTERVIVSQMHRSPGVLFDHDRGKTHSSGKYLFAARVIPYRGSWLDFEFDAKDIVNVRIDRKRKLPVTALLYALGLNGEEILDHFYNKVTWVRAEGGWKVPFVLDQWRGAKPTFDIVDAASGEVVFPAGQKISPRRQQGGQGRLAVAADPDRGNLRPLCRQGPDRRIDRPHLDRGGRRSRPKTSMCSTAPGWTSSTCSTSTMSAPARGSATR
jgi:DNA-directed RNA polymerase subunit beta